MKTETYECQMCGHVGEEKDFTTDVDAEVNQTEMTCEECYDWMDAQ